MGPRRKEVLSRIEVSVQTRCAWLAGGPAGRGVGGKAGGTSLQQLGGDPLGSYKIGLMDHA